MGHRGIWGPPALGRIGSGGVDRGQCALQGRFTLLLGPPGSGKSTLLKALSGKLDMASLRLKGDVTFNGHHQDEFVIQRTAAYVEQVPSPHSHKHTPTCAVLGRIVGRIPSNFMPPTCHLAGPSAVLSGSANAAPASCCKLARGDAAGTNRRRTASGQ